MYAQGMGIEKNLELARQWYMRAANQGHGKALNNLGVMHADGVGVDANAAWAVYYYALAIGKGNEVAIKNIERPLGRLVRKKVSASSANIRAGASTSEKVVGSAQRGTDVYILATKDGWHEVYLRRGHTLGWMSQSVLQDSTQARARPAAQSSGPFPPAPAPKQGYVTCRTSCQNGDCYRTYSDGRQVRFQAQRKLNPFTNQWEFDSGGC
jgi:hypothetical protein